ncbi:MAG: GTP-binding protein [Candidatus Lokiarchaeota archaeon]|nr:GTP-binding protein [Candidatus Lokiarchaeota archaeon]
MEKQLNQLIKNFIDAIENVDMIALIDRDGLVLMSMLKETEDAILGAITAAFDMFIERLKQEFMGSEFINIMTLGKRKFFFASVGDNAILTVVANEKGIESEIRVYSELALGRVNRILSGEENVSLEIPGIIKIMSKMKVFSRFKDGKLPKGIFTIKVILCGDYRVGKTSLIRRFVNDSFEQSYVATIGVDISRREMRFDENCTLNFLIWDIGGQLHQMAPYRKRFYNGAHAAFLIFDKTRRDSFLNIKKWTEDIDRRNPQGIPKILIGNKTDLTFDIEVTDEEIMELSEKLGFEYIETSAKTGENVDLAFKYIALQSIS